MTPRSKIIIDVSGYGLALILTVEFDSGHICNVNFMSDELIDTVSVDSSFSIDINTQIADYFSGYLQTFSLPIKLYGTPFQQRVWQALQAIPYGDVMSYGELAKQLGTSARAIGGACRANPIPLIVPCHRIVAANDIGGFSGDRYGGKVSIKQWLLTHEQARSD